MTNEEKIEYVIHYLQQKLKESFVYPFNIIYEQKQLQFVIKNGQTECRARTKDSEEIMRTVLEGNEEEKQILTDRILQVLQAAVSAQESTVLSDISDYEKIKSELILRPLSWRHHKEEIRDVPYIRMGDIVLVLYAVMAHVGSDYFTAKVRRSQMADWKHSESETLEEALMNTAFLYPPRLYSLEDVLHWEHKHHEDGMFMGEEPAVKLHSGIRGLVLTNTLELNGAIAVFYPGVAEKIAEGFDSDLYIGFTSIHEAQVHPVGMVDPDTIRESLQDINRFCNRSDEILTGRVFHYDRTRKSFGMMVDGERREVYWDAR